MLRCVFNCDLVLLFVGDLFCLMVVALFVLFVCACFSCCLLFRLLVLEVYVGFLVIVLLFSVGLFVFGLGLVFELFVLDWIDVKLVDLLELMVLDACLLIITAFACDFLGGFGFVYLIAACVICGFGFIVWFNWFVLWFDCLFCVNIDYVWLCLIWVTCLGVCFVV